MTSARRRLLGPLLKRAGFDVHRLDRSAFVVQRPGEEDVIERFGSVSGVKQASEQDLINVLGRKVGKSLYLELHAP